MLFQFGLMPPLPRSTPLPPLPPLHHSVCIFVRFALPLPLYPLISSLNKRHGHAQCTRTHTFIFTHTCTHSISHLDTRSETCKQAWRTNTHSGAEESKTQIQICVDINTATQCHIANSFLYLSGTSCLFCILPLEGSRGLWLGDILIRTYTHTHTWISSHWSDTGRCTVKTWSSGTHSLCDQSQAFYALRLL